MMNAFCASEHFDAFIAIPLLCQSRKRDGSLQLQAVEFAGTKSSGTPNWRYRSISPMIGTGRMYVVPNFGLVWQNSVVF